MKKALIALTLLSLSNLAFADGVSFKNVSVNSGGNDSLTITATIEHANESFSHFVKFVKVYTANGELLAKTDFPFARSAGQPIEAVMKNIKAPSGATSLTVSAYTSVQGEADASIEVNIK